MVTRVTVVTREEAKGTDVPSYKTTAAQVRFNQKVLRSGWELSTGTRHGQKTPPADSVKVMVAIIATKKCKLCVKNI